MVLLGRMLAATLVIAAATPLTSAAAPKITGEGVEERVALGTLVSGEVLALLRAWGAPSIAAGCTTAGGCSGRGLAAVAASLLSGNAPDDFTAQVLASASALDVLSLARHVAQAEAAGGIPARLVGADGDDVGRRRRLISDDTSSGVWIKHNDSTVVFGTEGDVQLARTGDRELTVSGAVAMEDDLVVGGDAAVVGAIEAGGSAVVDGDVLVGGTLNVAGDNATVEGDLYVGGLAQFGGGVTIGGHLEVAQTIGTGGGRITRDFHQYFTTTSSSAYYQMKLNIKNQGSTMFRLEILGYAYGAGENIDSVTTGYTYAGWDCVQNEDHVDFGYGNIDVYCSSDGYVVLQYYCPSTYYLGLSVSGWFLNPAGLSHDIAVLDATLSGSTGYYAGRRQLGEGEGEADLETEGIPPVGNLETLRAPASGVETEAAARPVVPKRESRRRSYPALMEEVQTLRARVAELETLEARVVALEAHGNAVDANVPR